MALTVEYLNGRYLFWKYKIAESGIWDSDRFGFVEINVRPKSKRYNGLFSRRYLLRNGRRVLVDRIFIYENSDVVNEKFIDSVLVHEMIHQYIFQNSLKDSSTHGKLFRTFMQRINREFPEALSLHISDKHPGNSMSGTGTQTHTLLILDTAKDCYCCVVNPKKRDYFQNLLNGYIRSGIVRKYMWGVSNDLHFSRFVRCTKTIHGEKMPLADKEGYCEKYGITSLS